MGSLDSTIEVSLLEDNIWTCAASMLLHVLDSLHVVAWTSKRFISVPDGEKLSLTRPC